MARASLGLDQVFKVLESSVDASPDSRHSFSRRKLECLFFDGVDTPRKFSVFGACGPVELKRHVVQFLDVSTHSLDAFFSDERKAPCRQKRNANRNNGPVVCQRHGFFAATRSIESAAWSRATPTTSFLGSLSVSI